MSAKTMLPRANKAQARVLALKLLRTWGVAINFEGGAQASEKRRGICLARPGDVAVSYRQPLGHDLVSHSRASSGAKPAVIYLSGAKGTRFVEISFMSIFRRPL